MKYPLANLLVVRKTFSTLKDSCFSDLIWAINRLSVSHLWSFTTSPLQITFLPTGQTIFFKGLDDPLKITSISCPSGYLCWLWVEEAFELSSEESFDFLQESIRGSLPPHLFKQITLTFNPWNEKHWLKKRFFDCPPNPDILAITTTYLCNEWLDSSDIKMFEDMKIRNFSRFQVAGLGNWGVSEGLVYNNFIVQDFDFNSIISRPSSSLIFGLDFGYTNDPTALFCGIIDTSSKEIFVFDELYEKSLTNFQIFNRISSMGYSKEKIKADSSEPKSIDELRNLGLSRISPAKKGRDSVNNGIQFIQGFKIIISSSCPNFLLEISNYSWKKDSFGKFSNFPIDDFNHLLDAMRYSIELIHHHNSFSFD